MRRRFRNLACLLSLLLCLATVVLWVHGHGRTAGWFFNPSKPFAIEHTYFKFRWCVQWRIVWSNDGCLLVSRQVQDFRNPWDTVGLFHTISYSNGKIVVGPKKPAVVPSLLNLGFYSKNLSEPIRWTPLPKIYPPPGPKLVGDRIVTPKTQTYWGFRGIEYLSQEPEFFPPPDGNPNHWLWDIGQKSLRIPLLYLFVLFAILPIFSRACVKGNVVERSIR